MRSSRLLISTLRESPAEAEIISHQLMLRAGLIRRTAAGIYSILPLGHKVLNKVIKIVREEMDWVGGNELLLPILQPAEPWQETGRWDVYGPEMFRLKDRHQRDFCLGPTHEEIITDLVKKEVNSYRQLPLLLYQIQNKYRDERRPRFGLMRGREFIMKDMYSFDQDEEGLNETYNSLYHAYSRIFSRCGLAYRPVVADSGAIGGNISHEFMVLADSGEAEILFCNACDYAANVEKAESKPQVETQEKMAPLQSVNTPGVTTIEEVADYLNVPKSKLLKTLLYIADGQLIAVILRGNREVNEIKLKNYLGVLNLELAGENKTELPVGFIGPVGLSGIKIYADQEVPLLTNMVTGANRVDQHYLNVNPNRDFSIDTVADLRNTEENEPCPVCGQPLYLKHGIEVGQIFKLGTKYSESLKAKYLDRQSQEKLMVMGCYGIGVTRTIAATIEQNHDKDGIIWPFSIAPYSVVIITINHKDSGQRVLSEKIYNLLIDAGIDVLLDDRAERAGVKFKDADLIGFPLRITVGGKAVNEELIELRWRKDGKTELIPLEEIARRISDILEENNE